MFVHPEHALLEFHRRNCELQAEAARHRLAKQSRPVRVRSFQLRSATASALNAAAQLIAPPAV